MKQEKSLFSIPGFTPTAWISLIFLYAPIFLLILFSFNAGRLITVWEGFSTDWYHRVWENEDIRRAVLNSLTVAMIASIIATVFAVMAALATTQGQRFRGLSAVYIFLGLPLLAPEIITAIATLSFFSLIGLKLGLGNVILAHIVFCIPFAYLPIRARLESLDPRLKEAARDLYADNRQTFLKVTLPLLGPGILSGAILAFITSLDDFIITSMVGSAGTTTLPVYIYGMIRHGITPEINAVSSVLLGISSIFVALSWFLGRKTNS